MKITIMSPFVLISRFWDKLKFKLIINRNLKNDIRIDYECIDVNKLISNLSEDNRKKIMSDANLVLEGNYCIFGKSIFIEENVNWSEDYLQKK